MKALVFDGRLRLRDDYPDPRPGPGEAVVRVRLAGICGTDLEIARGYMGFKGIPGHEFTGEVIKAAGGDPGLVGRRVVGEINAGCGTCGFCRRGLERHCPRRTVLGISGRDGCLAEFVVLPAANLLPIPPGVPEEAAVFSEPLAAALEILEQVHIPPGARLLILGDGKLGQLCALALAAVPAEITMAGHHRSKLELAAAAGVRAVPEEELGEERFDFVVEASGAADGFERALCRTLPRGTLVLKSTTADPAPLNPNRLVVDEITVLGSRCGRLRPALTALARGLDPRPLISAVYPMERALEAFAAAAAPESLKVLLDLRPPV